jgi:manganese/iron transport system ATP-binding protein
MKTGFPLNRRLATHKAGQPFLQADQIYVRYDGRPALEGITFSMQKSERVAVVGPNGAGKSTLFKVIAGVLTPTSGQINIAGEEVSGHICVAYLPQRSHVDWNFPVSVADVVMMGRIAKLGPLRWPGKSDWRLVHTSLAEVGLQSLAGRQIGELSGGQQQRMFIARALTQEAELLLMDEPLTGLDTSSQQATYDVLDELRQRGVTVMVATHDLDQAAEKFDQVMLLNKRLVGFGQPSEVFTTERLLQAYGGHLHHVGQGEETLTLADTCCDEGEEQ